jgi:hypothetical protein
VATASFSKTSKHARGETPSEVFGPCHDHSNQMLASEHVLFCFAAGALVAVHPGIRGVCYCTILPHVLVRGKEQGAAWQISSLEISRYQIR